MRLPGRVPAGSTSDETTSLTDVVGVDLPRAAGENSVSMWPLMQEQLYNPGEGPGETVTLAARFPDIATELDVLLKSSMESGRSAPVRD